MEPNEHVEKNNKEFSRWIEDLCRTCEHKRLFHLFNDTDLPLEQYVHSGCNFILTFSGFCKCPEWMSKDNLDYIELLAKRRGLIPDDEKGEKE